jgi:PEP-CTERM motif
MSRKQKDMTRTRLAKPGVTGLAVIAAAFMAASSYAAPVTFQNSIGITSTLALDAPRTFSPGATLSQAVNFGSGAQSVSTIGGQTINFAAGTTSFSTPSGTATTLFSAGGENNAALFSGDTGSAAFNSVLQSQGWASSGDSTIPTTLRIGGLTQGTSYVLELLASDMRAGSVGRSERYNDVATYTGNQSDSFSTELPAYVLATFTADSSGFQDVFIEDTRAVHPPWDTTLAGFTLYAVPEPGTCALLLVGAGMLLGFRRVRRQS